MLGLDHLGRAEFVTLVRRLQQRSATGIRVRSQSELAPVARQALTILDSHYITAPISDAATDYGVIAANARTHGLTQPGATRDGAR